MQGITSLEGHDKANNRMRNSLRMVVPQLSDEQKDKIMQDIMQTVNPQPEPAMPDNVEPNIINVGGQQYDMDQLQQMPMQAADGLADMGQGGDTELAHMDPETIAMAQAMGILPEAKQNVMTGLPAFQGDNPGEENENDENDTDTGTDTGTSTDPGNEAMGGLGGKNDPDLSGMGTAPIGTADYGTTPPPPSGIGPQGKFSAKEKADSFDRAFSGMMSKAQEKAATSTGHKGYDISVIDFAVPPSKLQGKTNKEKQEIVDAYQNARLSTNPTNAQLDMNAETEMGFQTANPGISQAVGIAGTLMGLAVPGVGLATTLGNVTNTIAGQPTLMDLAVGNPTMTSTAISGIKDSVSGFGRSITDTLSGIGSLVGGTPDDSRDELSDNEEPLIETVEEDLDDAVPPVAGVNAEQEKLVAEGYDPATAELIVENFRSVDAFKQSYRSRFNAEPSASEMTDPSKQSFINIRRGQIQGMT